MQIFNISDREQYVSDQWISPGESIEVEEGYGAMCARDLPHIFSRKPQKAEEITEIPADVTQEVIEETEEELSVDDTEETTEEIQEVIEEKTEQSTKSATKKASKNK